MKKEKDYFGFRYYKTNESNRCSLLENIYKQSLVLYGNIDVSRVLNEYPYSFFKFSEKTLDNSYVNMILTKHNKYINNSETETGVTPATVRYVKNCNPNVHDISSHTRLYKCISIKILERTRI